MVTCLVIPDSTVLVLRSSREEECTVHDKIPAGSRFVFRPGPRDGWMDGCCVMSCHFGA